MNIDPTKLEQFMGKAVHDFSANLTGVMVLLGQRLGLYAALAEGGSLDAHGLASATACDERQVREWLNQQAAAGYVHYDPATGQFSLPPEHALVLAREDGPAYFPAAYETVSALWHDTGMSERSFRTGRGVGWHEHHHDLFCGTEAFFKPGYRAQLASVWIPALTGIAERLELGGRVADVGCGHGASSIVIAQAFPNSQVHGFDYHQASIDVARQRAREADVADRVRFDVAGADGYPGDGFDLVCFMDCLHDLGDPVGAARRARESLAEGGSVLLVEPRAGDRLEDNLNPVGALFYAASTVLCVPNSLSQDVGLALGAQAGPRRLREVLEEAGFSTVRAAAETPFNLILEARV